MVDWATIKTAITDSSGLSRDALHLLTGMGAHLVLALMLRRSLAALLPWLVILAAAAGNEWFDYRQETWPGQWQETLKDIATTMALPSLLLLVSRFAPHLLVRPDRPADMETDGEVEEAAPAVEVSNAQ